LITSNSFKIASYLVDERKALRVASFMKLAQQIAEDNAESQGFGYNDLICDDNVWILSRMHISIVRRPLFKENVVLETWQSGSMGPFFIRDYELLSSEGSPCIISNSVWAVMNLHNRGIVYPDSVLIPSGNLGRPSTISVLPVKLRIPSDAVKEYECKFPVTYSCIDYNHHVNNAQYMIWAMDALGDEAVNKEFREIDMNFVHETAPGTVLSAVRYRCGTDLYVSVCCSDVVVFTARFRTAD